MDSKAKVSILLPVYNREHYLPMAIESVIGQSYQNWELLVSDNCSTDNTAAVASKYAEQDKRIKYWRNEKNIGSGLNYNKCIEKATGEYIELFGADDIFEPDCLEKFVNILNDNPSVVLVTSAKRHIDENGKLIREDRPYSSSQLMPSQEAIASNMRTLTNWIISPVMFRAKYKGSGFDLPLGIYCDLDYWAQILAHGDLYYIDQILFNYRVHPVSETTARLNNLEFIPTLLRTAERHKKYLVDSNESDTQPYKIVTEKLINMVDYATNFLQLNYDSFLGALSESKASKGFIDNADDQAEEIEQIKNDLRDYKRISYLALLHALELRKERDWLSGEYNDLLQQYEEIKGDGNGKGNQSDPNSTSQSKELRSGSLDQNSFRRHTRMIDEMQAEKKVLEERIDELSHKLDAVLTSQSWKLTAPLRMMKKNLN